MTDDERGAFARLAADPARCFARGCDAESEVMLHMQADPDRYADLCLPHARRVAEGSELALTCDCWCCERARRTLLGMDR